MRSLLCALCSAVVLTACAAPTVIPLASLPDWHGKAQDLTLLTPASPVLTEIARRHGESTREAGRVPTDSADGSTPAPLPLVKGWVVTQTPDRPVGSGATLKLAQSSSGKSDTLRIQGSRFADDPVMTLVKTTLGWTRARVREAYVLNARFFGLQLSDERFVLFDRWRGAFVDTAVDMHGVDSLVYVDRHGQPYLQGMADKGVSGSLKTLTLPGTDLQARLSGAEVFAIPNQ